MTIGAYRQPTQMTWEGDLVPPITSYAAATDRTSIKSKQYVEPSTNRTGSAVVNRRPRRDGLSYFYSHGSVQMPLGGVPRPGAGGVFSTAFQPYLTQLHDWCVNTAWFAAGYPRNLGYSFRVDQLKTQVTGSPAPGAMQARPLFPRIQRVPRPSVTPPAYATRSSNIPGRGNLSR